MSDTATLPRASVMSRETASAQPAQTAARNAAALRHWLLPAGIVALLLVVSAPLYFSRGIGVFDDSLFLKEGQLILDGLRPYRDFYDIKPPGIFYLSAMIAAVGGRGWLAPRIFLFFFAAVFQIGVMRWLQQRFDGRVSIFAAIFLGLSYPLGQGYSLHTEQFGSAAAFLACVVILAGLPSTGRWALAGALLGLSTVFKQTGVLYLAAFLLFAVLDAKRQNSGARAMMTTLSALCGGFAAVLVIVTIPFVAQGLARSLFDAAVVGAANRANFPFEPWYAIARTWILSPALMAFLGIVVVHALSRSARRAMDEDRRRAFGLFMCVGIFSLVPTLKEGLVGHYMQAGAFEFSAACALYLDAYLKEAGLQARLVAAATLAGMAAYFVAISAVSGDLLRQNRISTDLQVQYQIRQTLDARLAA
ncbi:MAG TPA: glycosyltransferase family 39 protein, partial [Vicinamibacterales bacterium]